MTFLAALWLAVHAAAATLGGHAPPTSAEEPGFDRRAVLEEMWRRRLIPPDHSSYSPEDLALFERMRRSDLDAVEYLRSKPGGFRAWTVTLKEGEKVRILLTKEGFERYRSLLTQDAIAYFESKGGDAKWVLKFTDWDGKRLFDAAGRLTEPGERVYLRARLNLEVFWKGPDGRAYGTRRPPTAATR